MRDLAGDLELCKKATPGNWIAENDSVSSYINFEDGKYYGEIGVIDGGCNYRNDAAFIAAARTGWPAAIERAIAAEARVESALSELAEARKIEEHKAERINALLRLNENLKNQLYELKRRVTAAEVRVAEAEQKLTLLQGDKLTLMRWRERE
jgi:chromosome segregation ATPase